jgi:hypothetical protein
VTELLVLVEKNYGNEALNYSKFLFGYLDLEMDGSWKKMTRKEAVQTRLELTNIAADLLKNDHRIISRMIAETLTIPKTVVLQILKEELERRKFNLVS